MKDIFFIDVVKLFLDGGFLLFLGGVVGIFLNRIFDRLNRKDEVVKLKAEVSGIKEENCLLCYGISACLNGLEQLGANHTVPLARDKIDKYLNKKAHD